MTRAVSQKRPTIYVIAISFFDSLQDFLKTQIPAQTFKENTVKRERGISATYKQSPAQVRKGVFENLDRYGLGPTRDRSSGAQ